MNSRSILTISFVFVAILIGIYSSVTILLNPTGGIAGLSKLITIVCIIISFVNPRLGIFVLAVQAIYNDQMKRIGVYYGAISMQTVQEILMGPLLTICALNAGVLIQAVFGKIKVTKLGIILYLLAPAMGLYYLSGGGIGDQTFMKRAYNGGVAGLYTTLIPVTYFLFNKTEEWIRFLSFQALVVTPSAAWAIWQYFEGFSQMEWEYALTGLSPVHTGQMLLFENPRVFGFFGSASALGCLSFYCTYALWRAWKIPKHRWVFFGIGAIMFAALIVSTQRSALISPLIFLIATFFSATKLRTIVFYTATITVFIVGIWQASWLLDEGLDKINRAIASDSKWGQEVLKVDTFSDRLRGWERLGQASSWTAFGSELNETALLGEGEFANHDMFNRILMRVGAVGIAIILGFVGTLAWILHKVAWGLPKGMLKSIAAFSIGTSAINIFMSAAGGDNFTTTPINLGIWSLLAGVFIVKKIKENPSMAATEVVQNSPLVPRSA